MILNLKLESREIWAFNHVNDRKQNFETEYWGMQLSSYSGWAYLIKIIIMIYQLPYALDWDDLHEKMSSARADYAS